MGTYLFDRRLSVIDVLPNDILTESDQIAERAGLITHSVNAKYTESLDKAAYFGMRDPLDRGNFWIYKIVTRKKEGYEIIVDGIYKLFDDLKAQDYIKDARPQKTGFDAAIAPVLQGSGWNMAQNSVSGIASTNFYYTSRLHAFWDAIKTWRCEFKPKITFTNGKIVAQELYFADSFDEDFGRLYVYGDRLLTVTASASEEELYTAFIGRGKGEEKKDESGEATGGYGRKITFKDIAWSKAKGDPLDKPLGQEYIEIPSATALYGYADGKPRIGFVEFNDVEDPAELLRLTYDYAMTHSRPMVQFKSTVFDDRRISLYEVVRIKNPVLNIAYKTHVFKSKRSFLLPAKQEIEFGEQLVKSPAQQTADGKRAAEKEKAAQESYIASIAKALTEQWLNEDGYNYDLKADNPYHLPAGFYSFNAPIEKNPSKMIGMSAGKLVISNEKNPDGSWKIYTFGTGDGFTANLIRAGMLQGGGVKWNLETGYLNIGDKLIYDPSTGELHLAQGSVTIDALDEDTKGKINQAIELSGAITDTSTEYAMGGCGNAAPMDGWSENALLTLADKNDGVNLPYNGDVAISAMRQEKMRAIKKDGSFSDSSFSLSELLPDRFYVYVDQLPATLSGWESSIPTYYTGTANPVGTLKRFYIEHYTDGGFQKLFKTGCLWMRTVYKCSDGTVKYSPAERVGKDGKRAYVHIAYADDDKGSGLSFDDADKAYMGQYTDQDPETSTDATRYKWTRIRGKDGTIGKDGRGVKNTITQYATMYGSGKPGTAGWSDIPPTTWPDSATIWQRLKITYTDGSIGYTEPEKFSSEAMKDLRQKMNSIESGYTEIKNGQARFVTKTQLGTVGETAINGYNITTGAIRSQNGATNIDLNGSNFNFGYGSMTYTPTDGLRIGGDRFYMTSDDKCFAIHSREWANGRLGGFRGTTNPSGQTSGVMLYASHGFNLSIGTQLDQSDSGYKQHIIFFHTSQGPWSEVREDMIVKAKMWAVAGAMIRATEMASSSDIRLKKDIKPWDVRALDVIDATDFIRFRWKEGNDTKEHYGVSAQSIPMAQVKREDGYLAVDGYTMSAINGKAIQELSSEIKRLKEENEEMRKELESLEKNSKA
ncbi:phage tail spike protein [Murdochiella massiliensis]|uniref:phage tail spike protein n=1 Tax=Murdochiella massiliensis TaxID=1673723 RepID=UPI0008316E50|nr:phage tail spike protein [Murdochiella massiliensis]